MLMAPWRILAHSELQSINLSGSAGITDKITSLLTGTNGVLLAALVSTFGEWLNLGMMFGGA